MKKPVTNVAASVRARLFSHARDRREDFQRVLQRYGVERLLARLSASPYRDEFVLKGAMLFVVWARAAQRPTRDVDLLGFGGATPEAVATRFREVCASGDGADGLVFEVESLRAESIRESASYGGVRVTVSVRLEKARFPIQVDVAFGEVVTPAPEWVEFPALLGGAPFRLRAYPVQVVLAEKFHAACVLGEANSRLKDFYDRYVLTRDMLPSTDALARALAATFERRKTPLPSTVEEALPLSFFERNEQQSRWQAWLRREELTDAPTDFEAVGREVRTAFIKPLEAALLIRGSA